jgi:hypothetical protein
MGAEMQAGRQVVDREAGRQADRQLDIIIDWQESGQTNRQITDRQAGEQTYRQTDGQPNRPTERQTDR